MADIPNPSSEAQSGGEVTEQQPGFIRAALQAQAYYESRAAQMMAEDPEHNTDTALERRMTFFRDVTTQGGRLAGQAQMFEFASTHPDLIGTSAVEKEARVLQRILEGTSDETLLGIYTAIYGDKLRQILGMQVENETNTLE